jgi:hypothetical protein
MKVTSPASRVVALDASAEMLQVARARRGAPALLADALALPIASELDPADWPGRTPQAYSADRSVLVRAPAAPARLLL